MEDVKLIVVPLVGQSNFKLEKVVCNHGFFMMAPNLWMPSNKSLVRPLRISSSSMSSVTVSISQPPFNNILLIQLITTTTSNQLIQSLQDRQTIRDQVARMLRISAKDEMHVKEFHRIYPQAKVNGFGRLFRSPSLFEDIIKSVLLCNCQWVRSLEMAQSLCDLQLKLCSRSSKRKRFTKCPSTSKAKLGNFPSSKELASLDEETLNKHCNLGYRASIILQIARDIEKDTINLEEFEKAELTSDIFFRKLTNIKGFGPFTVANIMMCIGFYQYIPVDTETIKHLEEVHGKTNVNKKNMETIVAQIYDKYAPYQCLVYWLEHVDYYEKTLGKLSELSHSQYYSVTTHNMKTFAG